MSRISPLNTSQSDRLNSADLDITVSTDLVSCRSLWLALQDHAVMSVFQTYAWVESWQSGVGALAEVRPVIVIGTYADGSTAFILPFGLTKKRGIKILTWLSAPHANYGCGAFSRQFLADEDVRFSDLWEGVVDVLPRVDAIVLSDQPNAISRSANPFLQLKSFSSPDRSHVLELNQPFDVLLREKFSSRTRRRLEQHKRQIEGRGIVRQARSTSDVQDISRVMFDQKRQQLKARGIADPFDAAFRDFFQRFALHGPEQAGSLRCYYLEYDGEIVATNFGAVHDGVYYGLITTMDEGRLDHASPGAMTMNFAIEVSCEEGLSEFDFSGGEAQYKSRWADRTVDMFETHYPMSFRGWVYCLSERVRILAKRWIKNSPALWRMVTHLRKASSRLSGGTAVL